ncbi:MAG: glycosyltransferase [Plesiomonas sp.]|uniref:glycosyltransferase n=1 Tax=Plesiomonas sp. TaxID=2486279 RepID=UPI003F3123B6
MHILHLIDLRKVGGVETMFCDFIRNTASHQNITHSIVMDHNDIAPSLSSRLHTINLKNKQGIKFYGRVSLPNRPKIFRAWNRLRLIKKQQPDIILIWNQFIEWSMPPKYVSKILRCPVVYYEHGMAWYRQATHIPQQFFQHVDACIAVSFAAKRILELKYHLIHLPISIEKNALVLQHAPTTSVVVKQRQQQPIRFGTAGRLVPLKCIGLLLYVVSILKKQGIACECFIAGNGPEEHYLKATAHSLDITEHVIFLGHIENMSSFYEKIDLYICPSMHESFSLSCLEAQAFGIPVITSFVDGLPEAVQHQKSGYCLEPTLSVNEYKTLTQASTAFSPLIYSPTNDTLLEPKMLSPQQIADSIIALYRAPEVYASLSLGAIEHAHTCRSFTQLCDSLINYLSTVNKRGEPPRNI